MQASAHAITRGTFLVQLLDFRTSRKKKGMAMIAASFGRLAGLEPQLAPGKPSGSTTASADGARFPGPSSQLASYCRCVALGASAAAVPCCLYVRVMTGAMRKEGWSESWIA